jgi:hypothetical protein
VSDALTTLALRAAAYPYFLAHRLAAYQTARGLTDFTSIWPASWDARRRP